MGNKRGKDLRDVGEELHSVIKIESAKLRISMKEFVDRAVKEYLKKNT